MQKQYRKVLVTGDDAETREYQLPRGSHINVQEGERVRAGEPLMDGPIDPHDILRVRGKKELHAASPTDSCAATPPAPHPGPNKSPIGLSVPIGYRFIGYFAEPNLSRRRASRAVSTSSGRCRGLPNLRQVSVRGSTSCSGRRGAPEDRAQEFEWETGPQRRGRGTVQSDRWRGPASLLAESKLIAVAPVLGWWDDREKLKLASTRFSLIVSVRIANVDIYTAIGVALQAPIEVDII